MKFVTKTLLVLLYTYLSIFSNFSEAKTKKRSHQNNCPCDTTKSHSSIVFRNFPIKVQLNWGGSIKDLDLYVRRRDGQSVNYQKKTNFDGKVHFITNDDRGGAGKQEALVIEKMTTGKYLIFVNNFSRDGHIGTSKGRMRFFIGTNQVLDVKVPQSDNNPSSLNWIVGLMEFSPDKAIFKLVNKLSPFSNLNTFFELPDEDGGIIPAPVTPVAPRVNVIPGRPRPNKPPRVINHPVVKKNNPPVSSGEKNYVDLHDFPLKLDLQWQAPNRDLDFYVRRADGQQVNYSRKVNFDGKIKLLKDDTGQGRHETITVDRITSGKYIVFVNNFSKDAHLSKSSAEVKISFNDRPVTSLKIPINDNNPRNINWVVGMFVFDNSGAKFIKANAFTDANGISRFFNTITVSGGSSPAPPAVRPLTPAVKVNRVSNSPSYQIKNKEMRIELYWSAPNKDLDLYFRRSDGQQVNYSRKSNFDNKVQLIKDDRGSERKETMVFHKVPSGKFILFVNNFSKDAHLSRSRANVKIFVNNQVSETVTIPSNDNNPTNINWVVGLFDFDASKFTSINKLTDANSVNKFFSGAAAASLRQHSRVVPHPSKRIQIRRIPPRAAPRVSAGKSVVQIVHKPSGLCLDARDGRIADGTKVILWQCHGGNNQKWHKTTSGNKNVFALKGPGVSKVMDVEGGSNGNEAKIIIWQEHGGDNQKWYFNPSNGTLKSAKSGKCLDVPGNRPGAGVSLQQYDCNGTSAQTFALR